MTMEEAKTYQDRLDWMIHAANAGRRTEAVGGMLFDVASAMHYLDHVDWRTLDCQDYIDYSKLQTLGEVILCEGDTLALPAVLSSAFFPTLVLPNNTELNSSSRVNEAADERFPEMNSHIQRWMADHSQPSLGSAVVIPGGSGFDRIAHLVCRKPGTPDLHGLAEGLDAASKLGEYRYGHLSIPVWGSQSDLVGWAEAICKIIHGARQYQDSPRFPIVMLFRREDRDRRDRLEELLLRRGILATLADASSTLYPAERLEAPESLLRMVSADGPVCPLDFARWVGRGGGITADRWERIVDILSRNEQV